MKIRTYFIIVLTVLFLGSNVSALTPYECGPGYYPTSFADDVPVNEQCEPCPAGTYQPDTVEAGPDHTGPSVCTPCPGATEVGMSYCPTPSPEFPTLLLPATMIIGFLGAVLFIQRTREH